MTHISQTTTLFAKPGSSNTQTVLDLVKARAAELDIASVLVATTTGESAVLAAKTLQPLHVIAVSHSTGFVHPNRQELLPQYVNQLKKLDVPILTAQHAFGGVNRAIRKMLNTYELDEIIAYTLRIWGQGMKVVVEMALMAADAGLVDVETPIICVAGTGRGADTAVVLQPTNAQTFFDIKIHEIICRPTAGHPAFRD